MRMTRLCDKCNLIIHNATMMCQNLRNVMISLIEPEVKSLNFLSSKQWKLVDLVFL